MSNYVTPSYWADGYTVTVTPDDDSTANEPYAPNAQGLTGVLIDLKDTIAAKIPYSVSGFIAVCFEDVLAGQALYARESDGKVGLAIANDTFDKANVIGFAQTSKLSGQLVRVLIVGVLAGSGYDAGDIYYLSAAAAGAITLTPPSAPGHYVVRVGEAASASELAIQLEPPIQLK
jgi:hypothetical protein